MGIKSFEDIVAWQKAVELYTLLYASLKNSKDYSYKDQLLRATLSISNNIAEGFDRSSKKEFRQFLIISRGSAAEVRSMLLISKRLNTISAENLNTSLSLVKDISRLLTGFIKSIDSEHQKQTTDHRPQTTGKPQ